MESEPCGVVGAGDILACFLITPFFIKMEPRFMRVLPDKFMIAPTNMSDIALATSVS